MVLCGKRPVLHAKLSAGTTSHRRWHDSYAVASSKIGRSSVGYVSPWLTHQSTEKCPSVNLVLAENQIPSFLSLTTNALPSFPLVIVSIAIPEHRMFQKAFCQMIDPQLSVDLMFSKNEIPNFFLFRRRPLPLYIRASA